MDYYQILGINKSASAEEIKSAYKKKAMQHHPDKGGDAETFKRINEAYQILSDQNKKQNYDHFGTPDDQQYRYTSQNFTNPDFDSIFENFGFNVNFGNGFHQQAQRNRDIKFNYVIELQDIFFGKTDTIVFKLPNGVEEIAVVKIPVGIRDGNTIQFQGQGDNTHPGLPRGDLLVQVRVKDHPYYRIVGNNIHYNIKLSAFDLLLGTTQEIVTPEGKTINLTIPRGTNPATKFTIPQHGLPTLNSHARGQMIIELTCSVPKLSDKQAQQLQNLQKNFNL